MIRNAHVFTCMHMYAHVCTCMYLHDGENDDSGGEEREDSVVWDETDRSDPVEPVLLETVLEAETHTHAAQNKGDTQKNPAINIDW